MIFTMWDGHTGDMWVDCAFGNKREMCRLARHIARKYCVWLVVNWITAGGEQGFFEAYPDGVISAFWPC